MPLTRTNYVNKCSVRAKKRLAPRRTLCSQLVKSGLLLEKASKIAWPVDIFVNKLFEVESISDCRTIKSKPTEHSAQDIFCFYSSTYTTLLAATFIKIRKSLIFFCDLRPVYKSTDPHQNGRLQGPRDINRAVPD
jgi:hypothetical protein